MRASERDEVRFEIKPSLSRMSASEAQPSQRLVRGYLAQVALAYPQCIPVRLSGGTTASSPRLAENVLPLPRLSTVYVPCTLARLVRLLCKVAKHESIIRRDTHFSSMKKNRHICAAISWPPFHPSKISDTNQYLVSMYPQLLRLLILAYANPFLQSRHTETWHEESHPSVGKF